jgi:2'-5' RNA ligase/GNAT superfamily N-acetyltransferase
LSRLRLGVALLIPPPVDRDVDAFRRALGDGSLSRIPAHLTLVPPVNVRDDRLGDALDVVRAAAASTRPFAVTLGPPATFLPDTPVVFLPVGGDGGAVRALRDRVFREPLARTLTWPFVPHVTLADEMAPERIDAALRALAEYTAEVTFDRVHVLQEEPGRVWRPIADATFAAPAVIGRGGLEVELSVTVEPDPEGRAFSEREWPVYDALELGLPAGQWQEPFAITAHRDGRVVGLAEGWTLGGVAYLSALIVDAATRGEGVGSHLLARFESLAAERDCPRLALRAVAGSRAERFYRDRGWVEETRLTNWWYAHDLVQLRRDL